MCLTHLRRVPADDATITGWVSSILLLMSLLYDNVRVNCSESVYDLFDMLS